MVYNLDISLADADRGVYDDLALRVALHPSETLEFMLAQSLSSPVTEHRIEP